MPLIVITRQPKFQRLWALVLTHILLQFTVSKKVPWNLYITYLFWRKKRTIILQVVVCWVLIHTVLVETILCQEVWIFPLNLTLTVDERMKGNAAILINRIPAAPDAAVDGLLWEANLKLVQNNLFSSLCQNSSAHVHFNNHLRCLHANKHITPKETLIWCLKYFFLFFLVGQGDCFCCRFNVNYMFEVFLFGRTMWLFLL